LRIWLKSFYLATVNRPTTGESAPRVPHNTMWCGCDQVAQVLPLTLHRWDKNPGGEVSLYYIYAKFPCQGFLAFSRIRCGIVGDTVVMYVDKGGKICWKNCLNSVRVKPTYELR